MVIYCYCFNYSMDLNNYALDLLVDDLKIDFLDNNLVLRWPATNGLVFSSSLFSKTEKNRVLFLGYFLSKRRVSPALVLPAKYHDIGQKGISLKLSLSSCSVFYCKISNCRRLDMKVYLLRFITEAYG